MGQTVSYPTGDIYTGESSKSLPHGRGRIVFTNQYIYEGTFSMGSVLGSGILKSPNGQPVSGQQTIKFPNGDIYDGLMVNGQFSGHGRLVFATGGWYDGQWSKNMKNGQGVLIYNDSSSFEGEFNNDFAICVTHRKNRRLVEGQLTIEYPMGEKYDGDFRGGQRSGQGRHQFSDGTVYQGGWYNDRMHGQGKLVSPAKHGKSDSYDGSFEHGLKHGVGRLTLADGTVYGGMFANNLYNGRGAISYPTLGGYDGEWRDGLKHGQGKLINADGTMYDGGFVNDVKCGFGKQNYQQMGQFGFTIQVTYEGQWENNAQNGFGRIAQSTGGIFEGAFNDGRKNGRGYAVQPNCQTMESEWVDDVMQWSRVYTGLLPTVQKKMEQEQLAAQQMRQQQLMVQQIRQAQVNAQLQQQRQQKCRCGLIFESPEELIFHQPQCPMRPKEFQKCRCGAMFESTEALLQHQPQCPAIKAKLKCKCGYEFDSADALLNHQPQCIHNKPVVEDLIKCACGGLFVTAKEMKAHQETCTYFIRPLSATQPLLIPRADPKQYNDIGDDHVFDCKCGSSFMTQYDYQEHRKKCLMSRSDGVKQEVLPQQQAPFAEQVSFVCPMCHMDMGNTIQLATHMVSHVEREAEVDAM